MKTLTFSFFLIAILIFSIGCNAENPICTTNFCAVGEVFPRSELEDGQMFSEVDIDDSVIFATLVGTPVPFETMPVKPDVQTIPAPATSGTLADIVSDVARNGVNSTYKDQTVTVTGAVKFIFDATATISSTITLHTQNEQISFFVDDPDGADDLAHLKNGTTYTFTVFIRKIATSTSDPERLNIFTDIENRPTKANIDIETVSMTQIVSDVAGGGKRYLGKTIRIRATVFVAALKTSGLISLSTNNANVSFAILDIQNPENLNPYNSNVAYTFTLYIFEITERENRPGEYKINAQIAND